MRTLNRRVERDKGFSLVEVMVAMVILAVGLLSLAQMMVVATNANALSGRMTACAALAKEQLELLRAVPFYIDVQNKVRDDRLADGGDVNADATNGAGVNTFQYYDQEGQPTGGNGQYVVRWMVENVSPPAMPMEMLRVTVRCAPVTRGGAYAAADEATFVTFRTANVN